MASYEQNKSSKLWSVRFRIIDETGEHNKRLSGFRRKADAEFAYREFMNGYVKPIQANKKDDEITFGQIYEEYKKYLTISAKTSSLYTIKKGIDNYILPEFKDVPVSKIDKKRLELWQNEFWKKDLKHGYKLKLRAFFNSILIYGHKQLDTQPSQFYKVTKPIDNAIKEEMHVWTGKQFQDFLQSLEQIKVKENLRNLYKVFFSTLFGTGMRLGEALALTWQDIGNDTIRINKTQTTKVFKNSEGDKSYAITSPKSKSSVRTISILPELSKDIKELQRDATGDFMFGGRDPISRTGITRVFNKGIEISGVPSIRIHDLRHTHASILISNGANIVAVSKRLGHSKVDMTINIYAHLMPKDEEVILKILKSCT